MFSQQDLLAAAREVDQRIENHRIKIVKAIKDVGAMEVAPSVPVTELNFVMEDDDPFSGNTNNRNVAKRLAAENKYTRYLNNSQPTHTGDPAKAARDVEKSLRVNPEYTEPDAEKALQEAISKIRPTPGSPAAKKADEHNNPPSDELHKAAADANKAAPATPPVVPPAPAPAQPAAQQNGTPAAAAPAVWTPNAS